MYSIKRRRLIKSEAIAIKTLVKDDYVTRVDNYCKLVANQERKKLCFVTSTADLNINLISDL